LDVNLDVQDPLIDSFSHQYHLQSVKLI